MNVNDPRWAAIDAFVEKNRDNILRDITRLVAVPSVEGAPEPGAPFGPGPKAALAKALEIADELGLTPSTPTATSAGRRAHWGGHTAPQPLPQLPDQPASGQ